MRFAIAYLHPALVDFPPGVTVLVVDALYCPGAHEQKLLTTMSSGFSFSTAPLQQLSYT